MINPGDECYLEDGRACIYHGPIAGMHAVSLVYESEEDIEPTTGTPKLVSDVYREPLREKFEKRIDELDAQIAIKHDQLQEMNALHDSLAAQARDMAEAAARIPALQRVIDFVEGRITHVVMRNYCDFKILTLDDCLAQRDDRGRNEGLKMVCLFGRGGADLAFKINDYRDGSGSWRTMIPARSLDGAREILAEELAAKFSNYLDGERESYIARAIDAAQEHGIDVPSAVIEKYETQKRDGLQGRLKEAQSKVEEIAAELAGME